MKTNRKFCQVNESQIQESGLLSPERMAEVTAGITARISPCFDSEGKELQGSKIADLGEEGRILFARCEDASAVEYMRRTILPAVLTESELDLVNEDCINARETEKSALAYSKAEKVESWDGGAFLGDQFFSSMDDLCDHLECTGEEWPEYVWAAYSEPVIRPIDVSEVVENEISDRGWEDMDMNDLNGVSDLQAALDKFVQANATVLAYHPDYSKAVLMAAWKAA